MSQQNYRTTASDWEAARIGSAVVASKSKLVGSLCVYLICVYLWLNVMATKRGGDRKNGELGTIGTMNARILFSTTSRTNHTNVKARVYLSKLASIYSCDSFYSWSNLIPRSRSGLG